MKTQQSNTNSRRLGLKINFRPGTSDFLGSRIAGAKLFSFFETLEVSSKRQKKSVYGTRETHSVSGLKKVEAFFGKKIFSLFYVSFTPTICDTPFVIETPIMESA